MDKNSANAWGKNEDGTVNTSGPRVVVGDGNMGPQGGFVTKYVLHAYSWRRGVVVSGVQHERS